MGAQIMAFSMERCYSPAKTIPLDVRPSQNFIQSVPQDVYIQRFCHMGSHPSGQGRLDVLGKALAVMATMGCLWRLGAPSPG